MCACLHFTTTTVKKTVFFSLIMKNGSFDRLKWNKEWKNGE